MTIGFQAIPPPFGPSSFSTSKRTVIQSIIQSTKCAQGNCKRQTIPKVRSIRSLTTHNQFQQVSIQTKRLIVRLPTTYCSQKPIPKALYNSPKQNSVHTAHKFVSDCILTINKSILNQYHFGHTKLIFRYLNPNVRITLVYRVEDSV